MGGCIDATAARRIGDTGRIAVVAVGGLLSRRFESFGTSIRRQIAYESGKIGRVSFRPLPWLIPAGFDGLGCLVCP